MAFFSFGKRVKNKKFEFTPRFYDASKESLEERIKMNDPTATVSDTNNPELSKLRIKDGLRRKMRGNKELEKKTKMDSNIRLFVILAVLITLAWVFLNSNALSGVIRWLESSKEITQ